MLRYQKTATPQLLLVFNENESKIGSIVFNGFAQWVFVAENSAALSRIEMRRLYNKLNQLEQKDKKDGNIS